MKLLRTVAPVVFGLALVWAAPTLRADDKKPASDVFGYGAALDEELKKIGQITPQELAQRYASKAEAVIHDLEVFIGVFVAALTFTCSIVAWGKLQGVIRSKPANWLEELVRGPRHVLSLSFNDVRAPAIFPLYLENRSRALQLASEPSQLLVRFADATFGSPSRSVEWTICRWRFVASTASSSTMPSVPTPAAAR